MAIANPLQPFLWGSGGEQMTPQQVARQREIAEALMGSVGDTSPVDHWLQGVPRLTNALGFSMRENLASEQESKGRDAFQGRFNSILGGGGGDPVAAALSGGAGGGALGAVNATGQAAPTVSSFNGSQQEFIEMLLPAAIEESKRTGVDPRIIVAQAAQETGWGKSAPGNNFFGIKSHGQAGGQTLNTHEYVNGKRVNIADSFRTFGSPEESVRGYGDFLLRNPRYKPLMEAQGLDAQLEALQASGYATDPNYSRSVGSIARGIALPEQSTQVASLDPTMNAVMTPEMREGFAGVSPDDLVQNLPNVASAPANPEDMIRTLPFQPQGGIDIPGVTDGVAEALGPSPMQAAQAAPVASQGTPATVQPSMLAPPPAYTPQYDIGSLIGLASDPWANDSERSIINALMGQEMQQQAQANDPLRQLQIERERLELEAMMNPGPGKPIEVGGVLLDPTTFEPTFDSRSDTGFTLSPGQQRFDAQGNPVAGVEAPADPGFQLLPPDQAAAMGLDPEKAWQVGPDNRVHEVGGSGVTVNNNMGEGLSPGQRKIDEGFADVYLDWVGGGWADSEKQIEQLSNAIGILESGEPVTGDMRSMLPREVQAFFNTDGLIAREQVEEVVQRSLREILGAQFTEREGERLIQRAFNPLLSPQENARRATLLMQQIQGMAQARQSMVDYFDEHGTIRGFQGQRPSMSMLSQVESEFGEDPQQGQPAPQAPNQSQANPGVVDWQEFFQ